MYTYTYTHCTIYAYTGLINASSYISYAQSHIPPIYSLLATVTKQITVFAMDTLNSWYQQWEITIDTMQKLIDD